MDVPASTATAKSKESVAFCAPLCSVKDDYIGKSRISIGGSCGSLGASSRLGGSGGRQLLHNASRIARHTPHVTSSQTFEASLGAATDFF